MRDDQIATEIAISMDTVGYEEFVRRIADDTAFPDEPADHTKPGEFA